ncbi:MAG: acyltransferase, partial [Planctomycetota bacterium]
YTVLGYPYVENENSLKIEGGHTEIGAECIIGCHVVVCRDSQIGPGTRIEDHAFIGEDVRVGEGCRIVYGSRVYEEVEIGRECVIGGFCCERAQIGDGVRQFGDLIHAQRDPSRGWDDVVEESPKVESLAFIGFGARVIGGIRVGSKAYVAAGSVVTVDVPEGCIVCGVNNVVDYKEWRGKLRESPFFRVRY